MYNGWLLQNLLCVVNKTNSFFCLRLCWTLSKWFSWRCLVVPAMVYPWQPPCKLTNKWVVELNCWIKLKVLCWQVLWYNLVDLSFFQVKSLSSWRTDTHYISICCKCCLTRDTIWILLGRIKIQPEYKHYKLCCSMVNFWKLGRMFNHEFLKWPIWV